MNEDVAKYHEGLAEADRAICDELHKIISAHLPKATNKVWHGHPVWFLDGNPIVGYGKLKGNVRMLFWSGQSFDEPALLPEGSFKAAEIRFTDVDQINEDDLACYLRKAIKIQWDYKNIVKNRGVLNRIS
jgi:hypothetical protein